MESKVIPVKVAVRIRPLVARETADACTECLRSVSGHPQIILGTNKAFTYDYVFAQSSPQIEIYETSVQSLIGSLFKGYNATVLAYGQTGSGKTHTMGSGYASLSAATASIQKNNAAAGGGSEPIHLNMKDFDDVGVIPRVLNDLFMRIDNEMTQNKDVRFDVKVSFVEVYNEEIKDLFSERTPGTTSEPLNIREENNQIRVVNLSEIKVSNAIETIHLLERGSSLRVVGGTAMNEESSRSHAIFTITLDKSLNIKSNNSNEFISSKFYLVDLAGSERQSKTKAEGIRLKEGININLGLLALGNVISVLGEDNPNNKVKHVPYRESKLTRLLQDSLGGNSHTVMIACVSPADSNMEESLNSLRYADRARKIKNKPIINIDPQLAELHSLRSQLQQMKATIYNLTGGIDYNDATNTNSNTNTNITSNNNVSRDQLNEYKEESEKLRCENTKLLIELNRLVNTNQATYARMLQMEAERDEQSGKFLELKGLLEKITKSETSQLSTTTLPSQVPGAPDDTTITTLNSTSTSLFGQEHITFEKSQLLSEIQSKLDEFNELTSMTKDQLSLPGPLGQHEDETPMGCGVDQALEPLNKEFTLKLAGYQHQLTEFDSELSKKQQLFSKMLENNMNKHESKVAADGKDMQALQLKIDALEMEKDELLKASMTASKVQNVADEKRTRLKQIELEYGELKKKEKEFKRCLKIQEENERQSERLRREIQHIKTERVKLIKQMKADTDSFRKYKSDKERQVSQLKNQERKRQVEISRLQTGNSQQANILRRKNEEIARIQKQLRDTSEKQRQVQEKRQQAFDRKDSSSQGDKLRTWVTQEIEVKAGLEEAQINLNKLIQERRDSAAELEALKREFVEEYVDDDEDVKNDDAANSTKSSSRPKRNRFNMDATYVQQQNGIANEERAELKRELEQKIKRVEDDIECKNLQINEIQQMVIENDDDRAKHMFNNIHGLLEAKMILKHLYSSSVQYLLDFKLKQIQYETTTNGLNYELKEYKKKTESLEEELNRTKKSNNAEISDLTSHYEQRIYDLIRTSALSDPNCSTDERYNTLFEHIQTMSYRQEKQKSAAQMSITIKTAPKSHLPKRLNGELRSGLGGLAAGSGGAPGLAGVGSSGDEKETYRRATKRIHRDHRKTHVIRAEDTIAAATSASQRPDLPPFDASDSSSSSVNPSLAFLSNITNSTAFTSPMAVSLPKKTKNDKSYDSPRTVDATLAEDYSPYIETPVDNKDKDPDYMLPTLDKDWTKTPLGITGKKRSKINKNRTMNKTKSKSNLCKSSEFAATSDIDENQE
jgi:kinesin family protein 4/21/27